MKGADRARRVERGPVEVFDQGVGDDADAVDDDVLGIDRVNRPHRPVADRDALDEHVLAIDRLDEARAQRRLLRRSADAAVVLKLGRNLPKDVLREGFEACRA